MSTTLTIGLTLLGFLVGFVIAALFSQSRVRALETAHTARVNALQADLDKRTAELAVARATLEEEQAARRSELAAAQGEATDLTVQLNIVRAQLEEFQADAGEMEDRLNAAEARILSSEAEMAQNRTDITRWSSAYTQLKATHSRLSQENREIQERRKRLEDELAQRRGEMEELSARLGALQSARSLQLEIGDGAAEQTVAAIALARAESEAVLRRREAELSDVRSRLSAMRYSINVLTAAGAELAAHVASQDVIDLEPLEAALPAAASRSSDAPLPPEVAQEELADLHGVIADWFGEMRGALPYDFATLRAFGGDSAAVRLDVPSLTIDAVSQPADRADAADEQQSGGAGDQLAPQAPDAGIPHAVMLAAIKALTSARMERAATRQVELARALADRQRQLDILDERIHAWRTMLQVTLAREPELLALLDEPRATRTGDLLSACATVALSAYQKKQAAQLQAERAPARPVAALPDEPRKLASAAPQPLALREWRPVRRARK